MRRGCTRSPLLPLLSALALLAPATAGHCGPLDTYLGLGGMYGSVRSDNPSLDGESGQGLHIFGGLFLSPRVAWELDMGGFTISTGEVESPYYPPDQADYAVIGTGPVLFLNDLDEAAWSPWISIYGVLNYIVWDSYAYDLSGAGFSPGAGLDLRIHRGLTFRLATRLHFVELESAYDSGGGRTTAQTLTLDLYYRF